MTERERVVTPKTEQAPETTPDVHWLDQLETDLPRLAGAGTSLTFAIYDESARALTHVRSQLWEAIPRLEAPERFAPVVIAAVTKLVEALDALDAIPGAIRAAMRAEREHARVAERAHARRLVEADAARMASEPVPADEDPAVLAQRVRDRRDRLRAELAAGSEKTLALVADIEGRLTVLAPLAARRSAVLDKRTTAARADVADWRDRWARLRARCDDVDDRLRVRHELDDLATRAASLDLAVTALYSDYADTMTPTPRAAPTPTAPTPPLVFEHVVTPKRQTRAAGSLTRKE